MIFLNNIDSVAMQPVWIHFCTHETEKNIQSLVCMMQKYRLLWSSFTRRHNDEKSGEKNIKENCFKSVKALKVIAILTAYLWFSL